MIGGDLSLGFLVAPSSAIFACTVRDPSATVTAGLLGVIHSASPQHTTSCDVGQHRIRLEREFSQFRCRVARSRESPIDELR